MSSKLKTAELDGMGRFYQSPTNGHWYPSVTTITGFAKKEFWAKWRADPKNMKSSQDAMR